MTIYVHRLVWGLSFTAANLETQRRLGVAVFSNRKPYTNSQRLAIADGSATYGPGPAQIDPLDPELQNFQSVYSLQADGSTQDYYIGAASLTDTQWTRIQSRIAFLPASLRYARSMTDDGNVFTLRATNVNALDQYIGTEQEESFLIASAGLTRYYDGGGDGGGSGLKGGNGR